MTNEVNDNTQKPPVKTRKKVDGRKSNGLTRKYSSSEVREHERNKRRKQRYADDPKYRSAVLASSRRTYMTNRNIDKCKHVAVTDVTELMKIGEIRVVKSGPNVGQKVMTFNVPETAEALGGYNPQVIYRWVRDELIPTMTNRATTKGNLTAAVFTLQEMRQMVKVMNAHQENTSCYLSKSHTHVAKRMSALIEEIREGVDSGE